MPLFGLTQEQENQIVRETLDNWFPALRFINDELNGGDVVQKLTLLYEHVGATFIATDEDS